MSRNASASQRPRPRIACWRHGPGSPAASARIHPVLRGSFPSNPSRNFHADAVTRSWRNKERSRAFTSRNDDAQSSSVVSTDAPAIHDPPNHGGPSIQKSKENATVMLALLWQIFSGTGFPNQFFNDSWVVGFWRADHGRHNVELGRQASRMAQAVLGLVLPLKSGPT